MEKRLELQKIFEQILGSRHVYFQPPESIKMEYPAIVYSCSDIINRYANNNVYMQDISYEVTVIDYDPDSEIVKKVSKLPYCRFDRHYTSDKLNHDTFTIYF